MKADPSLLQAALVGYEAQLHSIQKAMDEIRRKLASSSNLPQESQPRRRRSLSEASKQKIAAAQTKRWAAYKQQKAASAQ